MLPVRMIIHSDSSVHDCTNFKKLNIHLLIFYFLFSFQGIVTLKSCPNAMCYVNGREVADATVLQTGSRVILGKYHVFRFQNPEQGNNSFFLFLAQSLILILFHLICYYLVKIFLFKLKFFFYNYKTIQHSNHYIRM